MASNLTRTASILETMEPMECSMRSTRRTKTWWKKEQFWGGKQWREWRESWEWCPWHSLKFLGLCLGAFVCTFPEHTESIDACMNNKALAFDICLSSARTSQELTMEFALIWKKSFPLSFSSLKENMIPRRSKGFFFGEKFIDDEWFFRVLARLKSFKKKIVCWFRLKTYNSQQMAHLFHHRGHCR